MRKKSVWKKNPIGAYLISFEMSWELDAIQSSFVEEIAIQCGFCTPGMIMSTKALLMQNPHPSEEEIRLALSGNICRCSGYVQIVRAVQKAARKLEERSCNA